MNAVNQNILIILSYSLPMGKFVLCKMFKNFKFCNFIQSVLLAFLKNAFQNFSREFNRNELIGVSMYSFFFFNYFWAVFHWHVESQSHAPCIGLGGSLNHWTTREVPSMYSYFIWQQDQLLCPIPQCLRVPEADAHPLLFPYNQKNQENT